MRSYGNCFSLKSLYRNFIGFSHVSSPGGLYNPLLSQVCDLETAASVRMGGGSPYITKTRGKVGSLSTQGSTVSHVLLKTPSNNVLKAWNKICRFSTGEQEGMGILERRLRCRKAQQTQPIYTSTTNWVFWVQWWEVMRHVTGQIF